MRQLPVSERIWAMNSMKFPIMQKKADAAGIMWVTGPGGIIWDSALGPLLFMEKTVLPIRQI